MTPARRKTRNKKILAKMEARLHALWEAETAALRARVGDRALWQADHEAYELIFETTRPHVSLNYVAAVMDKASKS